MTVTSTPPGAVVYLNDTEIGRTPVETAFRYYGDYDVRLRLEGYEPVVAHRNLSPPVYEWVPLDLLVTALPFTVTSRSAMHFDLKKSVPLDAPAEQALLERAGELRARVKAPEAR